MARPEETARRDARRLPFGWRPKTLRSPVMIPDDIRKAAEAVIDRGYDEGMVEALERALTNERERWRLPDLDRHLIHEALRFLVWAAGEGLSPLKDEPAE